MRTTTVDMRNTLVAATAGAGAGLRERILAASRVVPDFPRAGVEFRDLGGVWADPDLFAGLTAAMAAAWSGRAGSVIGVDARGFVLGGTVAQRLGVPLVLARKAGKLPGPCSTVSYDLEYGSASLEIRTADLPALQAPLVVDDLLATGGTLAAVDRLVATAGSAAGSAGVGSAVVGFAVAVELVDLGGSALLGPERVWSACPIGGPAAPS